MGVRARLQQHREFRTLADEALVGLLVAGGLHAQRVNELCRRYGLTHDQYNILRILRGVHPGGHPRFEIGNRLINRAPDVTRLIDRLERQRLVERYWAPENRRHSMARITAAGLDLLAAIDPELDEMQQEVLDGLSPDDLRALVRICDHLAR
jgi:DNA-binding MarR family transcriptional regulator